MDLDSIIKMDPYGIGGDKKAELICSALDDLTKSHIAGCKEYKRLVEVIFPDSLPIRNIQEMPWLPVSIFKKRALKSIPHDEVFKVLTSSGTTGQAVSRIYLDRDTAASQVKALAAVMKSWLGEKRLPMVIIDNKSVIKDRKLFSARGAGILGMQSFGRDHFYALHDDMSLDLEGLNEWLEKYSGLPVILFGFTFMVWEYFHKALCSAKVFPDFSKGILIHSGGWKKLQDKSVSNELFKESIRKQTGIEKIHNFYGMVEQVGGVFVECEFGFFHTPTMSEILIRDPISLDLCGFRETGIIQVFSLLPKSYPGHSLLTEDLGEIIGRDDCKCGRKGAYFLVKGRLPRAEIRGCSDTHAEGV
jgi:phenylacetate-coenzyme A ligase PaaK-like adenylate-forming protein